MRRLRLTFAVLLAFAVTSAGTHAQRVGAPGPSEGGIETTTVAPKAAPAAPKNAIPQPAPPAPVRPSAEAQKAQELDALREDIRNTMDVAFEIKRELVAMRQSGALQPSQDAVQKLVMRINDLDQRLTAAIEDLANRLARLEPARPQNPDRPAPQFLPGPRPEQPAEQVPPLEPQPWRVEADARGKLLLFLKRDAEKRPTTMAAKDDCAAAGAWIDKQSVRLSKDAFFVRDDDGGIAVCRRVADGGWQVYSGNAATDRFHIVVKTGG